MQALFLHPWEETFASICSDRPADGVCRERKLPVLVMSGFPWLSEALQVRKLAARWPAVPIVMSNGGQINISGLGQADATLALAACPNLYIDTAGIYRQDFIEETVELSGLSGCCSAAGRPYFDQRYEIKRVQVAKVRRSSAS